jgi:tripartite-type tricarboxylate transporter receptor subunit TctC
VRLIVGFPPGGPADTVARLLGQPMSDAWHRPVVVQNAPGAAGNVAMERLAKSVPDGYTLGIATEAQLLINPMLYRLALNPIRDLSPVSQIAVSPYLLVVNDTVPARSVRDLIALAQSAPGSLTFASPGNGSTPHLAAELFRMTAAVDIRHVPYKGVGTAIPDLLGGRVTMMFSPVATGLPLVREGKLRALAVTSPRRSPAAPEVATIAELGYRDFEVTGWLALVAPGRTPPQILNALHSQITAALAASDVRVKLANLGLEPIGSLPETLSGIMKTGGARWAKAIAESGVKPD